MIRDFDFDHILYLSNQMFLVLFCFAFKTKIQLIHSISWKDTERKQQQQQHIYMNLQIIGLLLASARIRATQPTTQI